MDKIQEFKSLANVFKAHGFSLFLVGGTVRDYLLHLELDDMDAVSDATPNEILEFLPTADKTFAHLGSLKYKTPNGVKFDITTLREESNYFLDLISNRYPSNSQSG